MEAILPPPPPFHFINNLENVTSGNLSKEWEKWKNAFKIYYEACELKNKSAIVQTSVLLHVIGEQCREVFSQFNSKDKVDTVDKVLKQFDLFFLPKKNITVERHKFFIRSQEQGESVEQYAFELKKLASLCEFKDLMEDLIRDRLICGIREDGLRERLLREPDLDLKKLLDICNIAQISKMQACVIKKESSEQQVYSISMASQRDQYMFEDEGNARSVDWVSRGGLRNHRGSQRGRGRGRPPWGAPRAVPVRTAPPTFSAQSSTSSARSAQYQPVTHRRSAQSTCPRCGFTHQSGSCPATGRRCLRCNNYDHFSRMCNIYEIQADESNDQVIYCFSETFNDWTVDLMINDCEIKFKLDTGADVNVLPASFLRKIGILEQDLGPSSVRLRSYSGNNIKVIGRCNLKVMHKNRQFILEFLVADVTSPPILGRDSCSELNVIKLVLSVSSNSEHTTESKIFRDYFDVFEGVGCMPGQYKIEINKNIKPVVHAPRKLPLALKDSVKAKLDEMIRDGIIAKVEGPTDWVNSMTVVRKTNGDIRICLDPRDLNKAIRREHFRLPTLDEITADLGGSKYFSTLDAKHGFWQLKLHAESSDLCTFNTSFGRHKFLRLPFGITSASEVFHKKMYENFDDLPGVCLFIDDILVYGSTKEEHDHRLRKVLDRCRDLNIKLNKDKCKFGLTEIKYLGHKITQRGIYPDDSHTSAIRNMPRPMNVKDLERFLGMVNYVGNFISNLSGRNHVLRELLKKDIEWHWNTEHEKAFNDLKKCLLSVPVLQYYSLTKPIVISVDACKNGLGACLLQDNLPVCYASRSLTKAEQNYAQIEKELLACVYACEKFYTYLYGRGDITIETDHKPLVSIISKPIATAPARLQRMLLRLQPYCFKLIYKPGKFLFIADTLSRAVEPVSGPPTDPRDQLEARAQVCAVAVGNPLVDTHFIRIQKLTREDPELVVLANYIMNGWPTHKQEVKNEVRSYWGYRDELSFAYDMLWKGNRIIIPCALRGEMLRRVHIGHLGLEKCKLRIREIMFWPNINTQLEDLINNCQACLTFKNQNRKESLIPHEVPNRAWSKIGVDVFHFNGSKYLIAVDYYSKYVEVTELNSLTSDHIIQHMKIIFSRQGIPDIVMSDNGPEFSSQSFRIFSKEWNFQHLTSSPHYAQSNGQTERIIQNIKNMLKKTQVEGTEFRLALLEYLNTPISNRLASPSELLNNRKLRSIVPCSPKLLLPKIQKYVKSELQSRQAKQKEYYDIGARDLTPLVPGQKIKVRINKRWVSGTVLSIRGIRSYAVQLDGGGILIRNRRHLLQDSERRPDRAMQKGAVCSLPYDDIITSSDNMMTSLPSAPPAQRSSASAQNGFDSPAAPVSNMRTTNNYVTRSGRTVIPPDRWGD